MTLSKLLPWVMLAALGGLPLIGAGSGDALNPFAEATRPNGGHLDRAWKKYRNYSLKYCVEYPSRWQRGEAFDGSGFYVEAGRERRLRPSGEIDFGPLSAEDSSQSHLADASMKSTTLEQDLKDHLEGLQKFVHAERLEVLEQSPLKVQGMNALFAKNSYYDPLERATRLQELVFVQRNEETFRFELECPPDQLNRFEPVFVYMVKTFEVDCSAK